MGKAERISHAVNIEMKIINWNVGRPTASKTKPILDQLNRLDGDILVLTETNSSIVPTGDYNLVATDFIAQDNDGERLIRYKEGENRTSIWSRYPITTTHITYDQFTSVCAEIETPFGTLTLYATIIGVFNGLRPRFPQDFDGQISDFEKIFPERNACLVGDYNITFSGFTYPSKAARQKMTQVLENFSLSNLTADHSDNVDHISISNDFIKNMDFKVDVWNTDKKLSDHIGVAVTLSRPISNT